MNKKKSKLLTNLFLFLLIGLIAQMFVPDIVSWGLIFNVPHQTLEYVAGFGLVGAIVFTIWFNYKHKNKAD